jgi:hypothetical protein
MGAPRLVSVAKLADFERGQVSYADFIGITILRRGRLCERFSRHFRYELACARGSFAERRVGRDVTIAELAHIIAGVMGFSGEIAFDTSRPDGTPRKFLDVSRLIALGWQARIGVTEGIASAYVLLGREQSKGSMPRGFQTPQNVGLIRSWSLHIHHGFHAE